MLSKLYHENIVKFRGVVKDDDNTNQDGGGVAGFSMILEALEHNTVLEEIEIFVEETHAKTDFTKLAHFLRNNHKLKKNLKWYFMVVEQSNDQNLMILAI